jgi:two-component system, cell cycle response regulator
LNVRAAPPSTRLAIQILRETPTDARWARLLSTHDATLIDAGATGERTVARLRLVFTAIITLIPLQSVIQSPGLRENYIGLGVALFALTVAAVMFIAVWRGFYRTWLSVATSVFDVSMVSVVLGTFVVVGLPEIAVNSRVVYEVYLLALASTCLRYDPRAPVIAGTVAVVQYAIIVLLAHSQWDPGNAQYAAYGYGTFSWGDQAARIIVLGTAAALSRATLARAERLRLLSTHDALTGLLNRNVLEERIGEEVIRARRYKRPLSIAILDLDFFKGFNDAYGHAAGDTALRAFSQALRRAVRRTDILARFGGEEFVIVLPETAAADAAGKLEQIRRDVEAMELPAPRGALGRLTLSAGVAELSAENDEALEILQRADELLLEAKRSGRNRVMTERGVTPRGAADA